MHFLSVVARTGSEKKGGTNQRIDRGVELVNPGDSRKLHGA